MIVDTSSSFFIKAPLAKFEDFEDTEKREVEVDRQVVTGNEIMEVSEEPAKEMTVSTYIVRGS